MVVSSHHHITDLQYHMWVDSSPFFDLSDAGHGKADYIETLACDSCGGDSLPASHSSQS